ELCRLHKPSGCGAVDREKGLVCNGHPTALQAPHQATHGFLATQLFHRNESLKQVKTNRRNMLHEVHPSLLPMLASTPWRVEYLAASSASTVTAATFPLPGVGDEGEREELGEGEREELAPSPHLPLSPSLPLPRGGSLEHLLSLLQHSYTLCAF